jgi:hypothetical protein
VSSRDRPKIHPSRGVGDEKDCAGIANNIVDQQVRAVDVGKSNVDVAMVYRGKLTAPGDVAEHDFVSEVFFAEELDWFQAGDEKLLGLVSIDGTHVPNASGATQLHASPPVSSSNRTPSTSVPSSQILRGRSRSSTGWVSSATSAIVTST